MTDFWSGYIIVLALANIVVVSWLLMWTRKMDLSEMAEDGTTGHEYDGIKEYNNPLPRWWLICFWGSIAFALGYLALYPGLGKFQGLLGWTSHGELKADEAAYDKQFGPLYASFAAIPIPELAKNERAMKVAGRIFANNCAVCHGSNARGGNGFPNLTDHDWLYGGEPEKLVETLTLGRNGVMPAWLDTMGEQGVREVVAYALSLSGRKVNADLAEAGQARFGVCAGCHGANGKGNPAIGAPNLTDTTWLHGGTQKKVLETVFYGRQNHMPSFAKTLGPERVHLMAAYVYSLSNK
ncbi:cytochrome-c oxidase, cbb3-type subunit III [Perlucidibaca aquatica]|uniref:cytochrome-c oxidase, cbb3-type subunit III n=1 Tax=Perlucidibaca aquatica TaxID=1852776 RepID=UPI00083B6D24|nr:cytochrome-c oxidase, cbb3-type subunit III [Perlucidibaca aquatica]